MIKEYLNEETLQILNNYFLVNPKTKELVILDWAWYGNALETLNMGPNIEILGISQPVGGRFTQYELISSFTEAEEMKNSFESPLKEVIEIFTIWLYDNKQIREYEENRATRTLAPQYKFPKKITKTDDPNRSQVYGLFIAVNKVLEHNLLPETMEVITDDDQDEEELIMKTVRIRKIKGVMIDIKGEYYLSYNDEETQKTEVIRIYDSTINILKLFRTPIIKNELLEQGRRKRAPTGNPKIMVLREELFKEYEKINFLEENNTESFSHFIRDTKEHQEGKKTDIEYYEDLRYYQKYIEYNKEVNRQIEVKIKEKGEN
ncbi:MAG: hypothetical protein ACFFBQ_12260 [Promethearchaeota archaeon]